MTETWGDTPLLRGLGRELRGRTTTARGPVGAYHAALEAFNAAPKSPELERTLPSRAATLERLLDALGIEDSRLEAYADALEWADSHVPGFGTLPAGLERELLHALTAALLADGELADGLEVVSRAAATHATQWAQALVASDAATLDDWLDLTDLVRGYADDPVFAATFFMTLGPRVTAEIPQRLHRVWRDSEAYGDGWTSVDSRPAWEALETFSGLLATASHTVGEAEGLDPAFAEALLDAPNDWSGGRYPPSYGEVGLLLVAGGFSDEFLLPVAAFAEELLPDLHGIRVPDVTSPWGVFDRPALTLLPAIADSPAVAGSQPRVLAQLIGAGLLDEAALDLAMLEAARRTGRDPEFGQTLADELTAVGVLDDDHASAFGDELIAVGYALAAVGASRSTVQGLQERASEAGRAMALSPDPEVRSEAARTLRDTPRWLRRIVHTRGYRIAGRSLPAAGVGLSVLTHLHDGRGPVETAARTGAGFAGAWAGGKGAATVGAPLLAKGPPGWIGYGAVVLGGGIAGGFLGEAAVGSLFATDPDANLWVDELDRELIGDPGPPELSERP